MSRARYYITEKRQTAHYHPSIPVKENVFDLVYKADIGGVKSAIQRGGTSVNLRNDRDQTLLHYALLYNQEEIASFLISNGADLDAVDNAGLKVKSLIQERYPNLYDKLTTCGSTPKSIYPLESTCILVEEGHVLDGTQVKELGLSDDCSV